MTRLQGQIKKELRQLVGDDAFICDILIVGLLKFDENGGEMSLVLTSRVAVTI